MERTAILSASRFSLLSLMYLFSWHEHHLSLNSDRIGMHITGDLLGQAFIFGAALTLEESVTGKSF